MGSVTYGGRPATAHPAERPRPAQFPQPSQLPRL